MLSLAGPDANAARHELQEAKDALTTAELTLAKRTSERDHAKNGSLKAAASKLLEKAKIARQEARFARNAAERKLRSLCKIYHDISIASLPAKHVKQLTVKGEVAG